MRSPDRIPIRNPIVILTIVVLACLSLTSASDCTPFSDLSYTPSEADLKQAGYDLERNNYYFCGPRAPRQFQCQCPVQFVCHPYMDPWGRDIGECDCCGGWLWLVVFVLGALVLIAFSVCGYSFCIRGRWWMDGFPTPLQPLQPKRRPPVIAAATQPLPPNLFAGYRSTDFSSGSLPPGHLVGSTASRRRVRRERLRPPSGELVYQIPPPAPIPVLPEDIAEVDSALPQIYSLGDVRLPRSTSPPLYPFSSRGALPTTSPLPQTNVPAVPNRNRKKKPPRDDDEAVEQDVELTLVEPPHDPLRSRIVLASFPLHAPVLAAPKLPSQR